MVKLADTLEDPNNHHHLLCQQTVREEVSDKKRTGPYKMIIYYITASHSS